MTKEYKLKYAIDTEIDVYINMLQEGMIEDQKTRNFVCRTVIPRFNILRAIIAGCETEECLFEKKNEEDC